MLTSEDIKVFNVACTAYMRKQKKYCYYKLVYKNMGIYTERLKISSALKDCENINNINVLDEYWHNFITNLKNNQKLFYINKNFAAEMTGKSYKEFDSFAQKNNIHSRYNLLTFYGEDISLKSYSFKDIARFIK